MQWRRFARIKCLSKNSRTRNMLCCGRKKENGRSVPDLTASPCRAPPGSMPMQASTLPQRQQNAKDPVLLQGDFRKVSGISSDIFRQIEAIENDHGPSTAMALEQVERRGEMIVRILESRNIGGRQAIEAAQKLILKGDSRHIVQLVEIIKRPGQTLGLYIREGNGADRSDGVFISRIALESAVYNSGCLRVGDEILAVNLVDVTHMSLDDVVIIMSIPRRLVLAIRQRRGGRGTNSPAPSQMGRSEQKPPVVVIKRDLRDDEQDDIERITKSKSSRERRTGDGREMTESRSRLGLGLNNFSPQSEQMDIFHNRSKMMNDVQWSYKPPPPPSVITEQPKNLGFGHSPAYYQNAGTLECLAEKVHSFYPCPPRRMSTGTGIKGSQSHSRFPRSGSDQHLPHIEYSDYGTMGRSLLRPSLKPSLVSSGGTLGRYGRYDQQPQRSHKFAPSLTTGSLGRRSRGALDYSSDTEATIGGRDSSYNYYNRDHGLNSIPRNIPGLNTGYNKYSSLPRDRPPIHLGLRSRIGEGLIDENDGNTSAPELTSRRQRDFRNLSNPNPSIFTSDEYRAWLRRAPSSSAICEQMRTSRDILNQQRAHRFSCSAENIHDALKNTEHLLQRQGGTLDRQFNLGSIRPMVAPGPVRSFSTQHIGTNSAIRSPSMRRMRQLLELAGTTSSINSISALSGHQSPAPTPSATLPRPHKQIDINPAEFSKYKLDKPAEGEGLCGMLWIHLLAGRGLRTMPDNVNITTQIKDLYCVLECDRTHKARTVVRSGDLQFDWDESFELDLVNNKQLDVLIYSWDPQHRHKLCYRGAISLAILKQQPLQQLALKLEPRGTIYIRLRHTDSVQLFKRRNAVPIRSNYPQLFGVDLETIVNRESKNNPGQAPVPLVLRRCVEEVERRGLDIIGLYRLCGSATKKRLLREAFEKNSRTVELSPEHVPDINVITGVLKDYLRELPEPLFTRCLFQMTVDALGVCLPDDPEGNAKLMLSILDCLPRANRATLVYILDHLSLVVSASERNKMNAHALATVMGPPLMIQSANTQQGNDVDYSQPIAVLKYLLQIWPQPHHAKVNLSGRRGESTDKPGDKVNALLAGKTVGISTRSLTQPGILTLSGEPILSTKPRAPQYPSVQGPLVPSHRVLQHAVQMPQLSEDLAVSVVPGPSQHLDTSSPGSNETSSRSDSGSGTDTIKNAKSSDSSEQKSIHKYEIQNRTGINFNGSHSIENAGNDSSSDRESLRNSNFNDRTKNYLNSSPVQSKKLEEKITVKQISSVERRENGNGRMYAGSLTHNSNTLDSKIYNRAEQNHDTINNLSNLNSIAKNYEKYNHTYSAKDQEINNLIQLNDRVQSMCNLDDMNTYKPPAYMTLPKSMRPLHHNDDDNEKESDNSDSPYHSEGVRALANKFDAAASGKSSNSPYINFQISSTNPFLSNIESIVPPGKHEPKPTD